MTDIQNDRTDELNDISPRWPSRLGEIFVLRSLPARVGGVRSSEAEVGRLHLRVVEQPGGIVSENDPPLRKDVSSMGDRQ